MREKLLPAKKDKQGEAMKGGEALKGEATVQ